MLRQKTPKGKKPPPKRQRRRREGSGAEPGRGGGLVPHSRGAEGRDAGPDPPAPNPGKTGCGGRAQRPRGGTWPRSRVGAGRGLGGRCPPAGVRGEGVDPGAAPVSPPPQPPRHANALPLRLGTSAGTHTHTHRAWAMATLQHAGELGVLKKKIPDLYFFLLLLYFYITVFLLPAEFTVSQSLALSVSVFPAPAACGCQQCTEET